MFTIRKRFKFEAAHALPAAYSHECERIHGHSYVVEVFLRSGSLNKEGMLIDFKLLKEIVRPLLDRWDHKLLVMAPHRLADIPADNLVVLDFAPTAENMAAHLFQEICLARADIAEMLHKVRVHETETGWAEYAEE